MARRLGQRNEKHAAKASDPMPTRLEKRARQLQRREVPVANSVSSRGRELHGKDRELRVQRQP